MQSTIFYQQTTRGSSIALNARASSFKMRRESIFGLRRETGKWTAFQQKLAFTLSVGSQRSDDTSAYKSLAMEEPTTNSMRRRMTPWWGNWRYICIVTQSVVSSSRFSLSHSLNWRFSSLVLVLEQASIAKLLCLPANRCQSRVISENCYA